jgi:lysophospholipase L1-like esterase
LLGPEKKGGLNFLYGFTHPLLQSYCVPIAPLVWGKDMDMHLRTALISLSLVFILGASSAYAQNVYVAFGDSITKGMGDDNLANGEGYPPLLGQMLPAPNNTVINAGDPGDTSSDGANKISTVLSNNPNATHVLIQFGTNDARASTSVSVNDYRTNLRKIIRAVEDAGKRPLLAKIPILYRGKDAMQPPCDAASASAQTVNQRIREYNEVIGQLAAEYNLEVERGRPLTPPDFYGYFESTNVDAAGKSVKFDDCVHPNDMGYQSMARLWAAVLNVPPVDGQPNTYVYKYKTATERISASDSFQPDDHLFLDVGANERWTFEALLWIRTTATGDFRFLWRGPTGSDVRSSVIAYQGNSIANQAIQLGMNTIWSVNYTLAVTLQPIYIKGVFSTRGTAGRIRLEWSQRAASGTTSVYFPSYLEARRAQ